MAMTDIGADSSAILAFLAREPGGAVVLTYPSILICAVNHSEVVGTLVDRGHDDAAISSALDRLAYCVQAFDEDQAIMAGRLRRDNRVRALSLGDRACLSLALTRNLPVLTADRAWSTLELGVDVRLIR
jgi:PIN domain nuclease of toxin-antitoxin system